MILKNELLELCPNEEKLTNCLIYIFYDFKPSYSKSYLWNLCGKQIYENVRNKHTSIYFPIRDENGTKEFLYEKYSIEKVQIPQEDTSDMLNRVVLSQDIEINKNNEINGEEESI